MGARMSLLRTLPLRSSRSCLALAVALAACGCHHAGAKSSGSASSGAGGITGAGGTPGGAGGETATGEPRFVGRVDTSQPSAPRFAWQGAGVVARVEGSVVEVQLRSEGTGSHSVYFQPVIDGEPGARFAVAEGADASITLATGLPPGEHVVELYRDTEGAYGISTFLGFGSTTVVGAPATSGRSIEVVGDSISAGYGNLGYELHPNWVADPACSFSTETSSWYLTYAAIAGRAVGAEVSTVARSGWGAYRDYGGSTRGVLSAVYGNALGTDDATPWAFERPASAVVINLGTNDAATGDPGPEFGAAYSSLLDTVRAHHPEAWLFLAIGSMLSGSGRSAVLGQLQALVAARTEAGDRRVSLLDLGVQNLGADGSVPTGCDWHPSVAEHERMAGILESELRARLGW